MHTEFLEDCEEGRLAEHQIDHYLRTHVMTDAQRDFLRVRNLTVTDVLNGRFLITDQAAIETWMRSVNASAGGTVFQPEVI